MNMKYIVLILMAGVMIACASTFHKKCSELGGVNVQDKYGNEGCWDGKDLFFPAKEKANEEIGSKR
jgi:hypothetical protein